MVQVIIPISSDSKYFPRDEYFFPKPLISVDGSPMILRVLENLEKYLSISKYIFILPSELSTKYTLDKIISLNTNINCEFVYKRGDTNGALCSIMLGIDKINEDEEIIISNMDEIISYDLQKILSFFKLNDSLGGLISFESNHPRQCYLDIKKGNEVNYCAEKKVISKNAIAGFYYFKNKQYFYESAEKALLSGPSENNIFFISSSINQLILKYKRVHAYFIDKSKYHTFYKPYSISDYIQSKILDKGDKKDLPINIVIPAAGKGSRFAEAGWKASKPLIDINNKTMIEHVIENLRIKNSTKIIICQSNIEKEILQIKNESNEDIKVIPINFLTEGTACTVLKVHSLINNNNPLLIANSDQLVNLDCEEIVKSCENRNLDGIILTFKDSEKNPKWSFAALNKKGLVKEVAEKNPISDMATVGIYYFKKGRDFVNAAIEMIISMDKVNNEYYTCPTYNYLIKKGLKIGILEIDQSDMFGLGTPQDLNKFLIHKGFPPSKDAPN